MEDILSTSDIYLRPLVWIDLPEIHQLNSTPEVAKYNTIGIPNDEDETRKVMGAVLHQTALAEQRKYAWTIRMRSDHQFIGQAGLSLSAPRFKKGEIFYNLLPDYWGRGFGTDAARLLLMFAFEHLRLHRVEAGVAVKNKASLKVLEKIGMQREGRGIKILPIDGQWLDNFTYAILEEQYFGSE